MTVISSLGSGLLDRIGASRSAVMAASGGWTARDRQSASADSSTRVTLGSRDARSAVYSDPRVKSGVVRVWSSPVEANDAVSAQMASNREAHSYRLADQWRGLGGALLTRFGKTGEDYTQTLVDDTNVASDEQLSALSPEQRAQWDANTLATQAANLASVTAHAPTAGLTIQTRSGQSVELQISVNPGLAGIVGMKVELKSSGAMSPAERAAIEQLGKGLDRALEGLGGDKAVNLDLAGLMGYDRKLIASVDLKANNQSHQPLGTFALHLGDGKQSVSLKGSDGEITLGVDTAAPLANPSTQQYRAALQHTFDRIDAAGQRGQANAALVAQMKSAFQALQPAPIDGEDEPGGSQPASNASAPADAKAASALSGLADFDASFGGETVRYNRFGSARQAGQVHYQLSQTTTTNAARDGGQTAAQTVSEQLSADYLTAVAPDGMLDVAHSAYTTTRVRDRSTVTTLIEASADRLTRVLRKTDEDQDKTVTGSTSHGEAQRQSWPVRRSLTERIH